MGNMIKGQIFQDPRSHVTLLRFAVKFKMLSGKLTSSQPSLINLDTEHCYDVLSYRYTSST